MDIKKILKQCFGEETVEQFDEEVLKKFADILEESVTAKIDEAKKEMKDEILKESREEIFEEAVTATEAKTKEKIDAAVEQLDEEHTKMLESIVAELIELRQREVQQITEEFEETQLDEELVDVTSNFLDTYIEESVAQKTFDANKLERLEKIFGEAREIFMVSDDYIQSEVSVAMEEAKQEIDRLKKDNNDLLIEKVELNKKVKQNEAVTLLESNIEHLTEKEKVFVRNYFKKLGVDEISVEQINEAVEAYNEDNKSNKDDEDDDDYKTFLESKSTKSDGVPTNDPINNFISIVNKSKRI